MNEWLERALEVAKNAKFVSHKMGAIVVKSGKMLSSAHNLGCIEHVTIPNLHSKHAERRALKPFKSNYTGATLYVAREGKSMSRPCSKCMVLIKAAGIRKVVYFDWDSNICVEKVT